MSINSARLARAIFFLVVLAIPHISWANYTCVGTPTHIAVRFNGILQVYMAEYNNVRIGLCALHQREGQDRIPSYHEPEVCQSIYGLVTAALYAQTEISIFIQGEGTCELGDSPQTAEKVYTVIAHGPKAQAE